MKSTGGGHVGGGHVEEVILLQLQVTQPDVEVQPVLNLNIFCLLGDLLIYFGRIVCKHFINVNLQLLQFIYFVAPTLGLGRTLP